MIQIFTDTSANLPAAYIQKYSLRVIPLTYFVDGVEAHQDPAVDSTGKPTMTPCAAARPYPPP